ncbi:MULTISPECIES: hypothetical protein [Amycolatopsis]|uniref:Putative membrane protein n=1 Tax=Amycolatopsis japonica TaxID=208439 RepID=A0A075V365_9PSEU|nr:MULTISPECIES: hypothetical protein [Amycolatopsis]AIG78994.1 Putative membrane protein [Amycolatopsis japonica]OKJ92794.1 hypothetical protein AMK34_30490 [Amycolatopsis sp. CB00013]
MVLPVIMLYMTASTILSGDFAAAGCGFGRILRLTLFGPDASGVACVRLPFSADIPSIALGITSEVAVINYVLLVRRLRSLDIQLSHGERSLFAADQLEREPMKVHYERIGRWLRVRLRWQLLLLALVFTVGTCFYLWVVENNHLFKAMASIQGDARPSGAVRDGFRDSWWASWERNPGMAISWTVVGSLGTYFACCQAYLYYHLSKIFRTAPGLMVFRHVPARVDRDHGWRPIGRIIAIAYVSSISFICSVIALIYILRDPEAIPLVRNTITGILVFVALGGTVLNMLLVSTLRLGVARTFANTVRLKLIRLNQEIRELLERGNNVEARLVLLEAEQLAREKPYPIQGTAIRVLSLASGVIPVSKLLNDIFHLVF